MARATDAIKLALSKPDIKLIDAEKDTYKSEMWKSLFYIHNAIEAKRLKKETLAFVAEHMLDLDAKILNKLSDVNFDAVGKWCYMVTHGAKLADNEMDSIKRILIEMEANTKAKIEAAPAAEDVEEKPAKVNKPGIQDYMRIKAAEVCGDFEGMFDEYCANPAKYKLDADPKSILGVADLKAGHLRYVVKFYEPIVAELEEAAAGEDRELREAYDFLTKPQLRKYAAYAQRIVDTAKFMRDANVTQRKPRKKKPVDMAKAVAKLKFKDKDTDLDITSARPVHIVGANELWVYNVKTRKLGHYYAHDSAGLQVKGTSIKNFTEKSTQRTVRKGSPLDLKSLIAANKSTRNKQFKELKGIETKLNGRTNEHTLILVIDK